MSEQSQLVKATLKVRGAAAGSQFTVHFNPQSLQYTIANNMKNTGSGNAAKQYVDESTGKLGMDLVFDTTDSGEDVRLHTVRVAQLMEPDETDKTPPVVEFEWGLYTFAGMMENYKETIDYFSADGVPLRASVSLTLASQDDVFEGGSDARRADTGGPGALGGAAGPTVQTPPPPGSDGRGVTVTATLAGNPAAARRIARENGLENMRFPGSDALQVNAGAVAAGSVALTAAAGTNARFTGLRPSPRRPSGAALKLNEFLGSAGTARLATEGGGGFGPSGQAQLQGSISFKADVGAAGALKARIEFDGGE